MSDFLRILLIPPLAYKRRGFQELIDPQAGE